MFDDPISKYVTEKCTKDPFECANFVLKLGGGLFNSFKEDQKKKDARYLGMLFQAHCPKEENKDNIIGALSRCSDNDLTRAATEVFQQCYEQKPLQNNTQSWTFEDFNTTLMKSVWPDSNE